MSEGNYISTDDVNLSSPSTGCKGGGTGGRSEAEPRRPGCLLQDRSGGDRLIGRGSDRLREGDDDMDRQSLDNRKYGIDITYVEKLEEIGFVISIGCHLVLGVLLFHSLGCWLMMWLCG